MLTLILRSIMSLAPFIREVVDNLQKGPRDRRAKNPLATWLVLSIIFIVVGAATVVYKGLGYFETQQRISLENVELKHKIGLMVDVTNENLEVKQHNRQLLERIESDGDLKRQMANEKRDLQTTLTDVQQDLEETRKQVAELRVLVASLERDKSELSTQLSTLISNERAEERTRPKTNIVKTPKLSARTKALIAELQTE